MESSLQKTFFESHNQICSSPSSKKSICNLSPFMLRLNRSFLPGMMFTILLSLFTWGTVEDSTIACLSFVLPIFCWTYLSIIRPTTPLYSLLISTIIPLYAPQLFTIITNDWRRCVSILLSLDTCFLYYIIRCSILNRYVLIPQVGCGIMAVINGLVRVWFPYVISGIDSVFFLDFTKGYNWLNLWKHLMQLNWRNRFCWTH